MRKSYLIYKLGLAVLFGAAFQSCKKENGIDNNSIVKKPYGLYAGTDQGALLNTNDGTNYKTVFPADGFQTRALVTSGENIVWVKLNVHMSADNGKNFNPTYGNVGPWPWQPVIWSAQDQNRVYLSSTIGTGIAISDDNGKTWKEDTEFDPGITNNQFTSFAQLSGGSLFSHNWQNDSLYKRDNKGDKWTYVAPITALPGGKIFILGHRGNTLLATDISGLEGCHYSNDDGKNWTKYTGLPVGRLLYATYAPFDETVLVGTDSMGVYRLEGNNFVPSNNGLDDWTVVYSITAKEDIYKNDVSKRYVYIATNKGIYRSDDMGKNWALVKDGKFVSVY